MLLQSGYGGQGVHGLFLEMKICSQLFMPPGFPLATPHPMTFQMAIPTASPSLPPPIKGETGLMRQCTYSILLITEWLPIPPTPTRNSTPTMFQMATPTASPLLPPTIKGETRLTRCTQHLVDHQMATQPPPTPTHNPTPWHSGWPPQPPLPHFHPPLRGKPG